MITIKSIASAAKGWRLLFASEPDSDDEYYTIPIAAWAHCQVATELQQGGGVYPMIRSENVNGLLEIFAAQPANFISILEPDEHPLEDWGEAITAVGNALDPDFDPDDDDDDDDEDEVPELNELNDDELAEKAKLEATPVEGVPVDLPAAVVRAAALDPWTGPDPLVPGDVGAMGSTAAPGDPAPITPVVPE